MEKARPSHKPDLFLTTFGGCVCWAETFSLYSISVLTPPIATPWLVGYFIPDWEIVNTKNTKKYLT
jgi:hypothetical protein